MINVRRTPRSLFFFFNDTATTEIYTLSLHDALPIYSGNPVKVGGVFNSSAPSLLTGQRGDLQLDTSGNLKVIDRKSTRLNSSHTVISYAVFCLKKKTLSQ